ncbi:MAG TPA: type II toxin-antitoxin system RelE/ParE family toxin [Planctomycetota bacterium]
MKRVLLSARAQSDLEEIWLHVAQDSPAAADRLLDRIRQVCGKLAQAPRLGRRRPELARGLRSFPVATYLVFYRSGRKGIGVARVLSGYRDLEALFGR